MAAGSSAREELTEDEIQEHGEGHNQNGARDPDQRGQHDQQPDQNQRSEGDSHVAVSDQSAKGVGRSKKRSNGANNPLTAKVLALREQRDKMKQEAKKLSQDVKIENRKRMRLQKMAVKLTDNDLFSLMQSRGLPSGASSSQPTSGPSAVPPWFNGDPTHNAQALSKDSHQKFVSGTSRHSDREPFFLFGDIQM